MGEPLRNAVTRSSSSSCNSVITCRPTMTAKRSMISDRRHAARQSATNRIRRMLECLPQRNVELKCIDFLNCGDGGTVDEILQAALQAEEARRVRTERKVYPNGTDRGPVANPDAGVLDHVVEIL